MFFVDYRASISTTDRNKKRLLEKYKQKTQKNFSLKKWQHFLSQKSAYQLCIIGHFHPKKTLFEKHKFNKTVVEAIILKAWMDAPVYLLINEKLQVTLKKL